jgi:acetolactate synthase small subunit
VIGLFSQRGFNIETLTVAPTEDPTLSRLTLTTEGDDRVIEQVTKQLNKLIDVVKLTDLTEGRAHRARTDADQAARHRRPARRDQALRRHFPRSDRRC